MRYKQEKIARFLVEHVAYVNIKDKKGFFPIDYATSLGDEETAKYLLEHGSVTTYIITATFFGKYNIVKELLKKDPESLNKTDWKGRSPLQIALIRGYPGIAVLLIKHGADVNHKDGYGNTPLHYAVKNGYTDIVKLLIKKGANVNVMNKARRTPLHIAAMGKSTEMIKILLKHVTDIDVVDYTGKTPLYYAIDSDCLPVVKLLVDAGSDINIWSGFSMYPPFHKSSPLVYAVAKNRYEIAEYLVNSGKKISLSSYNEALFFAVKNNNPKMVNLLLPKISYIDENLHILSTAVSNNNVEITRALISKGLRATDYSLCMSTDNPEILKLLEYCESTPLHIAVLKKDTEKVKELVESGFDVNKTDSFGNTPLCLAAARNDSVLVSLLLKYGADPKDGCTDPNYKYLCATPCDLTNDYTIRKMLGFCGKALFFAVERGDLNEVKRLVSNGADVNQVDNYCTTPLFYAVSSGYTKIVKYLVDKGANVNFVAEDEDGVSWPLLHEAAEKGNIEIIKYLVKHGAKVDIMDDSFDTPCDVAKKPEIWEALNYCGYPPLNLFAKKGYLAGIKNLINKGINVNQTDKYGRTPLHWAVIKHQIDVVKYLMEHNANPAIKDINRKTPCDFTYDSNLLRILHYCK